MMDKGLKKKLITIGILVGVILIIYLTRSITVREFFAWVFEFIVISGFLFIYEGIYNYYTFNWLDLYVGQVLFLIVIIVLFLFLCTKIFYGLFDREEEIMLSGYSLSRKKKRLKEILREGDVLVVFITPIALSIIFFPLCAWINKFFSLSDRWVFPIFFILTVFLILFLTIPHHKNMKERLSKLKE